LRPQLLDDGLHGAQAAFDLGCVNAARDGNRSQGMQLDDVRGDAVNKLLAVTTTTTAINKLMTYDER
jgi:hypothetical protein